MPYIEEHRRSNLREDGLMGVNPVTIGELNFCITELVHEYCKRKGLNYSTINECIGVFECAKHEFYRRVAAPYEGNKMRENGDVYAR